MNEERMTKKVMVQYEFVRSSGANMFDYYGVVDVASRMELEDLGELTLDEYRYLLMNFNRLMKKYDIKQRVMDIDLVV